MKERQEIKFQTVNGNLLDLFDEGKFDIIAHGCNCLKMMSAGIAKQIKERFPAAYWADYYDNRKSNERLGSYSCAYVENKGYIYNLYTQYTGGNSFDLSAFTVSIRQFILDLSTFMHFAEQNDEILRIGFPLIGCGIGGGNWEEVEKIIKEKFKGLPVDITIVKYNEE